MFSSQVWLISGAGQWGCCMRVIASSIEFLKIDSFLQLKVCYYGERGVVMSEDEAKDNFNRVLK